MSTSSYALTSKTLRRSLDSREYELYRAGLEWSLLDPIVINNASDLKSEARWRKHVTPFNHQVTNLINFCRRLPVTLLADDVGLGKTISAGLIASELAARGRTKGLLIVAPKLLGPQWKEELETRFGIPAQVATGLELRKAEPEEGIGAVITTYDSARRHLEYLPQDRFQMLVLDEAHKLRNLHGVASPPKVAQTFHKALEERRFKFVLMLTATPIQNRLWDLYSLIDLLTAARGHTNPFGKPEVFSQDFIGDNPAQARQLRPEKRDEFQSIIYGYMSRVRRAEVKLQFPERVVLQQHATPTPAELELIRLLAEEIQSSDLNHFVQISLYQAVTSSPHALAAQLESMARKGTIDQTFAHKIRTIVREMPTSAKLSSLAELVTQLRHERPEDWRMVVFTCRRETQTTIEGYLQSQGISVGTINGDSGSRNSETLAKFKKDPPALHVIVSTEAGSEGVNLQKANVLVNFDLPWNPMIVEQRIGRVQRLGSEFAKVSIYNVVLAGTFEERIVARLIEKLQTISHAIGDIESLLEASGMTDGSSSQSTSFEEQIRRLVVDSLAGIDTDEATRRRERDIEDAKATLEEGERIMDEMLGSMDDSQRYGPRSPSLPPVSHSMSAAEFTISALESLGTPVKPISHNLHSITMNGREQILSTAEAPGSDNNIVHYAPGTPAFDRLVSRITQSGTHNVQDADHDVLQESRVLVQEWLRRFEGELKSIRVASLNRCFDGTALIQARITVAHDAYERLVEISCSAAEHKRKQRTKTPVPITDLIEKPSEVGLDESLLKETLLLDPGISEFRRFYLERQAEEILAAGGDSRKREKLKSDFTPRLRATVVGLNGTLHRELALRVSYSIDGAAIYESNLTVAPSAGGLIAIPMLGECSDSGRKVPVDCLGRCDITGSTTLRHRLVESDISKRSALPIHAVTCAKSGKLILKDEAEASSVTGLMIERSLLLRSAVSGLLAEPEHCINCAFTASPLLPGDVGVSEISGKPYRADQAARSAVSGRIGHKSEFITCEETRQLLAPAEGERCAVTNKLVAPGRLECCSVSGLKVLASELEASGVSGQKALRKYFVSSSISGTRILDSEAIKSAAGSACTSSETRQCTWSGIRFHPEDVVECTLTGLMVHKQFVSYHPTKRLQPLAELLDKISSPADASDAWPRIIEKASKIVHGSYSIKAARLSPDGRHLAVYAKVKTVFGFWVQYVGFVYALRSGGVVGRISVGYREGGKWKPAK